MKIKKLNILNYRGFKGESKIEFDDSLNVFVGVNGSGKSSVLYLIASFLNQYSAKMLNGTNKKRPFRLEQSDIHIDTFKTRNEILLRFGEEEVTITLKRDFFNSRNDFKMLNKIAKEIKSNIEEKKDNSLPVLKYYQAKRADINDRSNVKKRYFGEQFKVYENAFEFNFTGFIDWFIEEENSENRIIREQEDFKYENPKLKIVRAAIKLFFNQTESGKFNDLKVKQTNFNALSNEKISLVIDKNGRMFGLNQLSDGEYNTILMVAEIALLLAIANPNNDNALKGNGIVLIDEIEMHLHPAWQRDIIPNLQRTFPNIQFIITTHSPQVLSNIDDKHVFIIEDFKFLTNIPKTKGKDSNSILWDVFGVLERPKSVKEDLRKFYQLLEDESEVEAAKKILDELSEKLGEHDSEVLNAKLHYEFQFDEK